MATINGTPKDLSGHRTVQRTSWLALANGDSGASVKQFDFADRSVQVTGAFGVGGSVTIEGSNDDGATWATLSDPQGNALVFLAAKIEAITELCQFLRPRVTAGDVDTALNVYLLCRSAR